MMSALAAVAVSAASFAQGPPVTSEPTPPGYAFHASGTLRVVDGRWLEVPMRCTPGDIACEGTVTVRTRGRVPTWCGTRSVVTLVSGEYGRLEPGQRKRVRLPLSRAGRQATRRSREIPARITFRDANGQIQRLFLSYQLDVVSTNRSRDESCRRKRSE